MFRSQFTKENNMKKMNAILFVCGALTMVLTGCSRKNAKTEPGKVFTIYCWNEEFQARFNDYFAAKGLVPEGIMVNWVVTPNQNNAYQNKLDEALAKQNSLPPDERIDLFLVEADYALKYVDTPLTLDIKKDIGLSDADIAQQYQYTKDIMTDSRGALKGVSWQACPGGFVYRRSIARNVLGTDNPEQVQTALSDWAHFDNTAAKAKQKGYFMLSGFEDSFRVFSDNIKSPWVVDGTIRIDPAIKAWIAQTKNYTENGYNNRAPLWSKESWIEAGRNGRVFGYFGPSWFIDFVLARNSLEDINGPRQVGNGSYGDWAFCKGPQGFSWGGTWICGASGSDNVQLIHDIMYTLTCDADTLIKIAEHTGDFTNNKAAMTKIANSSYQNPFLGGQNHISFFLDSAASLTKKNLSPYDMGINESLQLAMRPYFVGDISEEQAWEQFYIAVLRKYPHLKR